MSTNNREFDFFALMASLEAHMLKDPNVRMHLPVKPWRTIFLAKVNAVSAARMRSVRSVIVVM